ncbi:hypothetical protein Agabi119p4_2536 [Agaricus bisporus var. burnettii]|uniref:CSC1/OSCA1-like N-terminal transmembrane domain-containing protein n=1 Tax=Agaricus bisporus var. burnettii TaxID=192524 RepID=A0A8H7F9H0_AGABI|nr:hypothetical protein Agabi119p4_2536 [Agaricus bisporus var. burnettii]
MGADMHLIVHRYPLFHSNSLWNRHTSTDEIFQSWASAHQVVYQPKLKYHTGNNAPPPIRNSFLGWTSPLVRNTEPEIIRIAGANAGAFSDLFPVHTLRWLSLFVTIVSRTILVPMNYLSHTENTPKGLHEH